MPHDGQLRVYNNPPKPVDGAGPRKIVVLRPRTAQEVAELFGVRGYDWVTPNLAFRPVEYRKNDDTPK
jgi:hypothetical protein